MDGSSLISVMYRDKNRAVTEAAENVTFTRNLRMFIMQDKYKTMNKTAIKFITSCSKLYVAMSDVNQLQWWSDWLMSTKIINCVLSAGLLTSKN